jgi:hypothetical protein
MATDAENSPGAQAAEPEVVIDIHIDRKPYQIKRSRFTGLELRQLAGLGGDVDFYREETGDTEDELIDDAAVIGVKAGQHFYSTPRHITPGSV